MTVRSRTAAALTTIATALALTALPSLAGEPLAPAESGTNATLNAVAAATSAHAVAVGDDGTIVTTADGGATWTARQSGTTADLLAVTTSEIAICGPGNTIPCYWAAGTNGTILWSHDGGATWCPQQTGTTQRINDLVTAGPNDVFAVGAGGLLLRSDNGSNARNCGAAGAYDTLTSGTTEELFSITRRPDGGRIAVGAGGTIVSENLGAPWSEVPSGTFEDLFAVASSSEGDGRVIAAGAKGAIVRKVGTAPFAAVASGTNQPLYAVAYGDGQPARVAGEAGTYLVSPDHGTTWVAQPSATCASLLDLAVLGRTFATGTWGTILASGPGGAGTAPKCGRSSLIGIDDTTVAEDVAGGMATITVRRTGPLHRSTYVAWAATEQPSPETAAEGAVAAEATDDFEGRNGRVVFAANEATATLSVPIVDDSSAEPPETFYIRISNPAAPEAIAEFTGAVTIIDDDGSALRIDDVTVTEGDSGTTNATFTVTRTGNLDSPAGAAKSVIGLEPDPAADPADFTVPAGGIDFAAGESSKTITIPVVGDTVAEADEHFQVVLANASGNATIAFADRQGVGTIIDDDGVDLAIQDVTVTETDSAGVTADVTVVKRGTGAATVAIATTEVPPTGGLAQAGAGADFTATTATLSFAADEATASVSIPITGDDDPEDSEGFLVDLSNPTNAFITDPRGLVTILDDDQANVVVDSVIATEADSDTPATFVVRRSGNLDIPVPITYSTAEFMGTFGAATPGTDFTEVANATFTLPAGATVGSFSVPVKGDNQSETREIFLLEAGSAAPDVAFVGSTQAVGSIDDDDGPFLSIDDATGGEGDSGTTVMVFTITRSGDTDEATPFTYTVTNLGAVNGADYTLADGSGSFAADETIKQLAVVINGDTQSERTEHFQVAVNGGTHTEFTDRIGIGTILDDDEAALTVADVAVAEGNSGSTQAVLTVSRNNAFTGTASVAYTTVDGTAKAGSDYTATSGTLTFAHDQASRTISVPVSGDTSFEADEAFTVSFSNPNGVGLPDPTATVTIQNDDADSGALQGYALVDSGGGIFAFGTAGFHGSTSNVALARPIVGIVHTSTGKGYWLVAADGGVFAFGDARFLGSTGHLRLNRPIVGMAATPTGLGYWLVASDGGVFAFGDAQFLGSTGGLRLNQPVVGMAPTKSGKGYWLVAADGSIFAFGDAGYFGSTGGLRLNRPVVAMGRSADGKGYWLAASDGGVFAFGSAVFLGGTGGLRLNQPITAFAVLADGSGYRLFARDGGVFAFGRAVFKGSIGGSGATTAIVGASGIG